MGVPLFASLEKQIHIIIISETVGLLWNKGCCFGCDSTAYWKSTVEHVFGHRTRERGHLLPDSVVLDSWETYREVAHLPLLQVHIDTTKHMSQQIISKLLQIKNGIEMPAGVGRCN